MLLLAVQTATHLVSITLIYESFEFNTKTIKSFWIIIGISVQCNYTWNMSSGFAAFFAFNGKLLLSSLPHDEQKLPVENSWESLGTETRSIKQAWVVLVNGQTGRTIDHKVQNASEGSFWKEKSLFWQSKTTRIIVRTCYTCVKQRTENTCFLDIWKLINVSI